MNVLYKVKNDSLENRISLSFPPLCDLLISPDHSVWYDRNSQSPSAWATIRERHEIKGQNTSLISIFPHRIYHKALEGHDQ